MAPTLREALAHLPNLRKLAIRGDTAGAGSDWGGAETWSTPLESLELAGFNPASSTIASSTTSVPPSLTYTSNSLASAESPSRLPSSATQTSPISFLSVSPTYAHPCSRP